MPPKVGDESKPANSGKVSSHTVFVQFAAQRKIAESTAKGWFYGNAGSPLWDVEMMASVAAQNNRLDIVEGFLQRIRAVSTPPPPYDEAWLAYNKADAVEDFTQAEFDAREREDTANMADARKRIKSIQREIATGRQYADALAEKYNL